MLKRSRDNHYIAPRGNLTRQLAAGQFMFTDGSAEIRVGIAQQDIPLQVVDPVTVGGIAGEVDKDFRQSIEIDVDRITVIGRTVYSASVPASSL